MRQGNSYIPAPVGPDGEPYGSSFEQRDSGSIAKASDVNRLSLSASYYQESICCYPFTYHFSASGDYLDFTLYDDAFTNPDYRQTGSFALTSGGGFFSSFVQTGPNPGAMTQVLMQAQTLTVAKVGAVPEVATWLMMIAGLGLAGGVLRRRDRRLPVGGWNVGRPERDLNRTSTAANLAKRL